MPCGVFSADGAAPSTVKNATESKHRPAFQQTALDFEGHSELVYFQEKIGTRKTSPKSHFRKRLLLSLGGIKSDYHPFLPLFPQHSEPQRKRMLGLTLAQVSAHQETISAYDTFSLHLKETCTGPVLGEKV